MRKLREQRLFQLDADKDSHADNRGEGQQKRKHGMVLLQVPPITPTYVALQHAAVARSFLGWPTSAEWRSRPHTTVNRHETMVRCRSSLAIAACCRRASSSPQSTGGAGAVCRRAHTVSAPASRRCAAARGT